MNIRTPLLAPFLLFLCACGSARSVDAPESAHLDSLYRSAIRDAAVAEPWEIYRELKAIAPQEPGLVWQDQPGLSPVLVVTWWLTPEAPEPAVVGEKLTVEKDVWVTLAPDLEQRCRRFRGRRESGLELRLRQLLGLPPEGRFGPIVEMWVEREALFRPCPDPEVTDHECELNFPVSGARAEVTEAHRRWLEILKENSYQDRGAGGPPPYPWTRLGYTYHWGQRQGEVGLSEFVIPAGTLVTVKRLATVEEYCRK